MVSVYDELSAKMGPDTQRGARDGARRDLGLMLFSQREGLRGLWLAAEACAREPGAPAALGEAVERLRPLFGERAG